MPHLPGQPVVSGTEASGQPLTRQALTRPHSAPPHPAAPRLSQGPAHPRHPKRTHGSFTSMSGAALIPDTDPWRRALRGLLTPDPPGGP